MLRQSTSVIGLDTVQPRHRPGVHISSTVGEPKLLQLPTG
jgi:hypothetical protein